ncbi:MAG: hypothetical protein QXV69_01080 [Sulfolobaceae archaeon]
MITIEVELSELDTETLDIIFNSILIEDIDKKYIIIERPLKVKISAPRISRGKAIMNSYIFWIYSILSIMKKVSENDGTSST